MSKLGQKLIKAAKQGCAIARRSAAAKDLGSPKYRKRVVESKKAYRRKRRLPRIDLGGVRLGDAMLIR